jgi:predicted MFS family arabinose efflux permease
MKDSVDPSTSATAKPQVPSYRWVVLAWICICFFLFSANWYQVTAAFPPMIEDLHISAAEAGSLISVFILTYGLFQLPSGILASRWSSKWTFIIGLLIESICSSLIYFAPDYMTILILRLIAGIGGGLFFTAAVSTFVPWFLPTGQLGLAMGLTTTSFFFLGSSIPVMAGAPLIAMLGWRGYVLLLGVIGVIAAILAILIVRAPPKEILPPAPPAAHKMSPSLSTVFKNVNIWLLGFGLMGAFGAYNTFYPYLPTFLTNFRGWDYAYANIFTATIGIISIIVSPIVGLIVDKWRPRKPQLILAAIVLAIHFWLYGQLGAPIMWILPIVTAIFSSFMTINAFSIPTDYLGPVLGSAGLGLLMEITMVAQTWIPIVYGMLIDMGVAQFGMTPEAASLAWLFLAVVSLTLAVFGAIIKEPRPRKD